MRAQEDSERGSFYASSLIMEMVLVNYGHEVAEANILPHKNAICNTGPYIGMSLGNQGSLSTAAGIESEVNKRHHEM